MKKAIVNSGIGSKVICVVTDDTTLEASPIKGADNGDGTASLIVTSSMATLPDTVSGDLAAQTTAIESIDGKLPVSLGKKTAGGSFSVVQADVPCTVSEAEYEMTASAIPLSATEAIYKYLFLMPDAGNSGTIYLGGSAVQVGHSIPIPSTGLALSFPVQADDIYVIGTALDVLYAISFEEA